MMRKLRTALSLSRQEWLLFWRAWFLLLLADLGLRLLPFPRLQSWFGAVLSAKAASPEESQHIILAARFAIDRAVRNHLYPMTCLRRSLALQRLLARQGIASQLRFGVQRQEQGITAHAWVEYNGQPLGEALELEKRYAPLAFQGRQSAP